MFIKITSSGPRRYVQLVEAFRDASGAPKQRTVATLGRLDQLSSGLESVICGLLRVTGRSLPADAQPAVEFESARDYGDVWALSELWNALGFDRLRPVFRRTRHAIDVEALVRVMVFNRLCNPDSKLGVLRWLETVSMTALPSEPIEHQHLLRAMDALVAQQAGVDKVISGLLRPLVDQDLAVVFYDMTTIRTEGLSEQAGDLRQFGMSKEGLIARQVMLGVVQTADGLPLYHEIFEGNTGEVGTLKPIIEKIVQRYPVKRIIAVADRGLLSIDNLADLQAMKLPSGQPLEFILAVPGRRYSEFVDLLAATELADDDTLTERFAALIEHTEDHFSGEDKWMKDTKFSSSNCHTMQHNVVLEVMREGLRRGRDKGDMAVMRQMAHELGIWFPQHAQTMDAALALHLRRVGYDAETGIVTAPEALPEDEIHGSGSCGDGGCA